MKIEKTSGSKIVQMNIGEIGRYFYSDPFDKEERVILRDSKKRRISVAFYNGEIESIYITDSNNKQHKITLD